jgi:cystathionine beta-lyase/cystathionine gamma-synthase
MKFRTLAIHAGHNPAEHLGAVKPPIYETPTFAFRGVGQPGPFDYSRSGNPTRTTLENCLAALEVGAAGFAFATGMAAETTVLMMFQSGARIIVHQDFYGGTHRLLESVFRGIGVRADYVDLRDPAALGRELAAGAQAVWIDQQPLWLGVDVVVHSTTKHQRPLERRGRRRDRPKPSARASAPVRGRLTAVWCIDKMHKT